MMLECVPIIPVLPKSRLANFDRTISFWAQTISQLSNQNEVIDLGKIVVGNIDFDVELELKRGFKGLPQCRLSLCDKQFTGTVEKYHSTQLVGKVVASRVHRLVHHRNSLINPYSEGLVVYSEVATRRSYANKGLATALFLADPVIMSLIGDIIPIEFPNRFCSIIQPEIETTRVTNAGDRQNWFNYLRNLAGYMGYFDFPSMNACIFEHTINRQ